MVKPRIHCVVNAASGVGDGGKRLDALRPVLRESFPGEGIEEWIVSDHAEAARVVRDAVRSSEDPLTLIIGGGGGTLRAAIEGACGAFPNQELPGSGRLRFAPLRMGSGNVLAKRLGAPADPAEALRRYGENLRRGRFRSCCVARYELEREGGACEARYAATLAGLGLLGRVPGILARWHRRRPRLRRLLARVAGIERLTDLEYGFCLLSQSVLSAVRPTRLERIELLQGERVERGRLLVGAVLNFPVPALPFAVALSMEDQAVHLRWLWESGRLRSASLVLSSRTRAAEAGELVIGPANPVTLRLLDRDRAEMFLDEDPIELYRTLRISIAGSLGFVSAVE